MNKSEFINFIRNRFIIATFVVILFLIILYPFYFLNLFCFTNNTFRFY